MKMNSPNLIVYVVTLLCLVHFSSGVRMLREEKDETDPNKRLPFNFPPLSGEAPNSGFNIPFFNMSGFGIPGFGGGDNPFNIPGFGGANNPFNIPIPGVPIGDIPIPGVPSPDVPAPDVAVSPPA